MPPEVWPRVLHSINRSFRRLLHEYELDACFQRDFGITCLQTACCTADSADCRPLVIQKQSSSDGGDPETAAETVKLSAMNPEEQNEGTIILLLSNPQHDQLKIL